VDSHLRTNVKNIYAAGDVVGGYQFKHFAGWQAFQAVRNALLPGSNSGFTNLVPWVTFTDPEVQY
jgi:pyruvate/2-oxoglutarate dehydrogenase complex dihydrolipoamide dehydrogenase (E3) component